MLVQGGLYTCILSRGGGGGGGVAICRDVRLNNGRAQLQLLLSAQTIDLLVFWNK